MAETTVMLSHLSCTTIDDLLPELLKRNHEHRPVIGRSCNIDVGLCSCMELEHSDTTCEDDILSHIIIGKNEYQLNKLKAAEGFSGEFNMKIRIGNSTTKWIKVIYSKDEESNPFNIIQDITRCMAFADRIRKELM